MGLRLAGLARRVEGLETRVASIEAGGGLVAAARDGAHQAVVLAERLKLPGEVFWEPSRFRERRKLTAELRKEGWSGSQIARVLGCSERTVARYFKNVKRDA